MNSPLIERAEQHEYQKLFLQDLNWSRPDQAPVTIEYDGRHITATNVSQYKGIRVWVVDEKPDSKLEAELDRILSRSSVDRILILHDEHEQVWRWPVRRATGNTTTTRLSRHRHRTGDTDPRFATKLNVIRLPFDVTLDSNTVLAKVRQAFDVEAHNETKHASKLMARLYTAMERAYPATTPRPVRDHEISVTLARVLFLLFGDDTDMWQPDLFSDFIRDHTAQDGSDIGAQLTALFDYLDTPDQQRGLPRSGLDGFRYVNGRIFTERVILPVLNAEFRAAVLQASDRDWATISPAIFGSMFQSVRDDETRRQLGEHYTSEENILKTLNPLFLDELRAEFEHIRTLGKYEADRLRKLREKLGRIQFMDPACGCGNFIIVAYRELRDLELAIMERLQEITGDNPMLLANVGLSVSLDHFYGIEIDEWPARIAETAMFLVDRQCDLKLTASLGYAPDRLPIQEQATIVVDNALRLDWATVCPPQRQVMVAGNPPFLGPHTRTKEQLVDLQSVWGTKDLGRLDYVTGWHRKCVDYFTGQDDGRFALVSTSSVAQGDQATRLFPYIFNNGWRLRFAHQTFAWTSEATGAAAVHCVITGFDKVEKPAPVLFKYTRLQGATTRGPRSAHQRLPHRRAEHRCHTAVRPARTRPSQGRLRVDGKGRRLPDRRATGLRTGSVRPHRGEVPAPVYRVQGAPPRRESLVPLAGGCRPSGSVQISGAARAGGGCSSIPTRGESPVHQRLRLHPAPVHSTSRSAHDIRLHPPREFGEPPLPALRIPRSRRHRLRRELPGPRSRRAAVRHPVLRDAPHLAEDHRRSPGVPHTVRRPDRLEQLPAAPTDQRTA
jgi:hypothetical protein